eukprot:GSMAST32.ASY1.ANO1.984.1 assembled CDS
MKLPSSDELDDIDEAQIRVELRGLPDAMDTACHVYNKWPLVIDSTGNANRYLKYNGAYIMANLPSEVQGENLRKIFIACLKRGNTMILNFGDSDCSTLTDIFDPEFFPATILDRRCYCDFFFPNEGFKLVIVTENTNPTTDFDSLLKLLLGAKEVIRNSEDLTEFAFDGDLDGVKDLIEKGYFMDSVDAHDHSALSEAAAQGHAHVVEYLLSLGANPNKCNDKGRSPLYRAAFNGHLPVVQFLLESGADPDKHDEGSGEMPMDACTDEATQNLLSSWDREKTKSLLIKREEAIQLAAESRLKTAAERELYARGKIRDELVKYCQDGEKTAVEELLNRMAEEAEECSGRPTGTAQCRDPRGNTLLAVSAWKGHIEIVEMLLTKYKTLDPGDGTGSMFGDPDKYMRKVWRVDVNAQDQKGWTPIQVAVFHKHVNITRLLLEHGADPSRKNSYGKDAFSLAQVETPPNIKLMRWYDHELFKKDMEEKNNYKESECTLLLNEWARTKRAAANTLGAEKAATEIKSIEKKSAEVSNDNPKVQKVKKKNSTKPTPKGKTRKKKKRKKK